MSWLPDGNTRRKNRHAKRGHSSVQLTFFKVCVQCVTKDKDIRSMSLRTLERLLLSGPYSKQVSLTLMDFPNSMSRHITMWTMPLIVRNRPFEAWKNRTPPPQLWSAGAAPQPPPKSMQRVGFIRIEENKHFGENASDTLKIIIKISMSTQTKQNDLLYVITTALRII